MKCPICDDTGFKTPGRPCPMGCEPRKWYDARPEFVEGAAIVFAVIALTIVWGIKILEAVA